MQGEILKCIYLVHQEDLVLGLLYNPNVSPKEYTHSYKRTTVVMLLACVLVSIYVNYTLHQPELITQTTLRKSLTVVKHHYDLNSATLYQ